MDSGGERKLARCDGCGEAQTVRVVDNAIAPWGSGDGCSCGSTDFTLIEFDTTDPESA